MITRGKLIRVVFLLSLFSIALQKQMLGWCPNVILAENVVEEERFREFKLPEGSLSDYGKRAAAAGRSLGQYAALCLCADLEGMDPGGLSDEELRSLEMKYETKQASAFTKLSQACEGIFSGLRYFPVAADPAGEKEVRYEDSWMGERTFGGNRRHEGVDLMGAVNERGVHPIVSVSDGVVENVGWLKLGGYRIGVRSPGGAYFYYAHLSGYARAFQKGDSIRAGDVLGYMGDSGYGEEGTVGKFAVHLHFGIYVRGEKGDVSVNPYHVLKILENHRKVMCY